jgi:hypothetical protein
MSSSLELSMKSLRKVLVAAVITVAVGLPEAQAGLITLQPVGGGVLDPFQTPPLFPPSGPANNVIPNLHGYLNGDLVLDGDVGVQYLVQFTLVWSESPNWTNLLRTAGGAALGELADVGKTISYVHTATGADNDFLKFQFETTVGSPPQSPLLNGNVPLGPGISIPNGPEGAARTFFVSFCIGAVPGFTDPLDISRRQQLLPCNTANNSTTGDGAWLALDDGNDGADDNHDDWVGFVRVSRVPDGGVTAGLLGAGLLVLGVLSRRFNA